MSDEISLSFRPRAWRKGGGTEKDVLKLAELAKKIRDELTAAGVASWELDLEGSLEASSRALPGGKVTFTATLKLSSSK